MIVQKRDLLPNLQANLPPLSHGAKEGCFWVNKPRELCDVRFQIHASWTAPAKSSLSVLMAQWFRSDSLIILHVEVAQVANPRFWHRDFDYQQEALCIRSGGSTNRPPSSSSISVLDPFIRSKVSSARRSININIPFFLLERNKEYSS